MIRVRCPICAKEMHGQSTAEWPEFPFCSQRCKLIDLGRWFGEDYRLPSHDGDFLPSEEDERNHPP